MSVDGGSGAEFAALAMEAAADRAAADDVKHGAPPGGMAAKQSPVDEWRDALVFVRHVVTVPYPKLAAVYTDEEIGKLAEAIDAVARKYGFTMSTFLLAFKEEIGLAMVAFPLVKGTLNVLREAKSAKGSPADKASAPAGDASEGGAGPAAPVNAIRPNS